MAPEQAQGLAVDVRTDIYALGVVIFEMLAGRVPFDADTTGSIRAQHLVAPVPLLSSYNPRLPAGVQAVLEKALAKEPGARYQAARELGQALALALTLPSTRVESPPPAPPQQETRRLGEPPQDLGVQFEVPYPFLPEETPVRAGLGQRLRRHPGWLAGGGVVVLLAVILAATLGGRGEPSSSTATTPPLEGAISSLVSSVATAPFMTTESTLSTLTPDGSVPSGRSAALRAEAESLLRAGKFNEAIAKYTEALRIDPNDAKARTGIGVACYDLPSSPQLAAQHLETAVALAPGNVQAWAFLGASRYVAIDSTDGTDYSSAQQACNRAVELDPGFALAHGFPAKIHLASGQPAEALAEASQALTLGPDEPEVLVAMGDVKTDAEDLGQG